MQHTPPPLIPINGRVLVKLGTKYKHIEAAARAYETKTSGIVVAIADDVDPSFNDYVHVDDRVFWEQYKEGASVHVGEDEYAFINFEDIQGVELAVTS